MVKKVISGFTVYFSNFFLTVSLLLFSIIKICVNIELKFDENKFFPNCFKVYNIKGVKNKIIFQVKLLH